MAIRFETNNDKLVNLSHVYRSFVILEVCLLHWGSRDNICEHSLYAIFFEILNFSNNDGAKKLIYKSIILQNTGIPFKA